MKFFSAVAITIALACFARAVFIGRDIENSAANDELSDLIKRFAENLKERGPAVNWTFNSWMSGGPTCVDNTNFTVVDLEKGALDSSLSAIHELLDQCSAKYKNEITFGFGMVYNGKIIDTYYAGHVKKDSQEKAKDDTVIAIGSISKIFTSLMMNILADQDKLKVTDPVTKYFNKNKPPSFNVVNPYDEDAGASAVTLESLASQTSGLPRESLCSFTEQCTEEKVMTAVNIIPLYHEPLTRPHYSNIGFNILGHCCERAAREDGSNLTYEEWLTANVFKQWDMTLTGFDYPDDIKKRMAGGYTIENNQLVTAPLYATSIYWSNPAGGIYSTTEDMLKFASHLLAKDSLLSPDGFEQYFLPGAILSDGISSYGKSGWEVAYSNGFRTITKGGLIGGFGTELALVPELKLGTFVWANLQRNTGDISAFAQNALVPAIMSELAKSQPKHEAPPVEDFLGNYSYQGIDAFVIGKDNNTDATGIYYGSIPTSSMTFWGYYDKQTTTAYNVADAYFFRLFLISDDTCFIDTMGGLDDTVIMFMKINDKWTMTYMDSPITLEKK